MGVLIVNEGKNVSLEEAEMMIGGYFLAIDFTCSSIKDYRERKLPYCIPKIKDNYFVISDLICKD